MTKSAWTVVCIIAAVVFAGISVVSAALNGCSAMVELASGNSMPMKCHWTFVACAFIGIIGIAIALLGIACKDKSGRRVIGALSVVCAAVVACIPAPFGIGLCAAAGMHCYYTAYAVWALCALAAIIGIVQLVKADPSMANLPKQSL